MAATATAPSTNGATATTDATFPVDSFKDAAPHLRRPFTQAAVKFKVQATWDGGALIVAYIDARLVVERLNLVCPHLWFDEYQPVDRGLLCRLTVDGITRHDIGDGYQGKGLYSDAFKRAAVKFGVGVSLYATPQTFLDERQGHLKRKKVNGKDSYVLTSEGEKACRQRYADWLEATGTHAFGAPLDHGDVVTDDGATGQGDTDVAEPVAEPAEPEPTIEPERAKLIAEAAKAAKVLDKLQLAATHTHGEDVGDCSTVAKAAKALAVLTGAEATRVEKWINDKVAQGASA